MTVTVEGLRESLRLLDLVVSNMNLGRGSTTAQYGHRMGGGTKEHPDLPISVEAFDRQREAWTYVLNLALRVAQTTRVRLPKWDGNETTPSRVHGFTNYLSTNAETITEYTNAQQILNELNEHTRRCEQTRTKHEPRVFAGICTCGAELYASKNQPEARCGTCSRTYEVRAWRNFAAEFKNEHIATPPELSRLLSTPKYGYEVSTANIRMWANRQKLQRANPETNEAGEPIPPAYKLGDILNLVTDRHRIKPLEGRTA